jgi:hypothetical protein
LSDLSLLFLSLGASATRGGAASSAVSAVGSGRSSVTVRPLPSNTTERVSTERNIHPEALSPSRTPVEVLELSSKRIAIRLFSPIIVPTSVNGGGDSGATGLTTAGGGAGAAATVAGGGRRDEENNGRSRVAESFETGMAHKGLPVAGASAAGGPASAGDPASAGNSRVKLGPEFSISIEARAISSN